MNTKRKIFLQPDWLIAAAITGLIVWVHIFFLLHVGGFWRDEVNLINLSNRPSFGEMEKDSFPILMPLLVKVWSAGFGRDDLTLRFLGVLIGLGIPAALWLAALKIHRAPPLAGLVLLGLNSTVILFGDSLRAYGLGSLIVILTVAAACLLLENPTWTRTAIFSALAILCVQAMYQNALFIAAICFGAWTVCARQRDWRTALKILIAAVVSAASLLPYLPHIFSLPAAAKSLRIGYQPNRIQANFSSALGFPVELYVWVWIFFFLAVVAVALIALRAGAAEPAKKIEPKNFPLFAGITLLVAVAAFEGFLRFASVSTETWYFIPLMALAAVCFEIGIPRSRRLNAIISTFAVVTVLVAIVFARNQVHSRLTNVDSLAQRLNTEAGPDDFIVVSPWYCGISFNRYFKGAAAWETLPPLEDHSIHRYDLVWQYMETPGALQPVFKKISATLQSGHRVWFLTSTFIPRPGDPLPADPPPPPLENFGWSDWPYNVIWSEQVAQFLSNHSRQFTEVMATNRDVVPPENLMLEMAGGWRTASATNAP